jgi:hypothetical protein
VGNIRKRHGKFQAQVRREGVRPIYKTFTNRKDAIVWVRGIEARIDTGETNVAAPKAIALADLLIRYSQEVTPAKKGRDAEQKPLFHRQNFWHGLNHHRILWETHYSSCETAAH